MPHKDPQTYPLVTYAWVLGLAIWGGAAHWVTKIQQGKTTATNLAELVGDLTIAGFVGVLTFYLCQAADIDLLYTAAAVGIAGHMGTRAIFLFEQLLRKNGKKLGPFN